ncbi:LysE family translocator [Acetobacteraceae bacterium]|nr:LysE family translocator [Acetobacteraceae bacterium]QCE34981.1 LysE family translocator [Acetobacteraceae bacterium]
MTSSILSSLLAYTVASLFLAATPGPDMILVLRSAIKDGFRFSFGVILGILTSLFFWGIATILGLSALLFHFKQAFIVLKWAGVLYLLYLALRSILSKPKDLISDTANLDNVINTPRASLLTAYGQGLMTNLFNPMIGFLFLFVFPAFIPKEQDIQFFTLILTFLQMLVAFSIFTSLALFAQPASIWLKKGKSAVWIDRIAGISLLYFAIKLFLAQPPV